MPLAPPPSRPLADDPGIVALLFVTHNRTYAFARGSLGALTLAARLMEAGVAHPDACACAGVEAT